MQYLISVLQKKVLFSAVLPTSIDATVKNNVLQYNHVITNVGSAYNPTDCVFTTPKDGYYVFIWSTSQYQRRYTDSAITKNGAEVLIESAYASNAPNIAHSASQTVTMYLVTGDRVWIKLKSGSNPYVELRRFYGVFTGFKL